MRVSLRENCGEICFVLRVLTADIRLGAMVRLGGPAAMPDVLAS